jgi:vacuolar-type H+-ATPase subunit H
MPALVIQVIQIYADLVIIIFVGYYFLKLWTKERELERKEGKIDTDYHHVVDTALEKERKIIDDATQEADQIISGAYYVNKAAKETVDQALERMIADIQKETLATARAFMQSYENSLKSLTTESVSDFNLVSKSQQEEMKKQIADYREMLNHSLTQFQGVATNMEKDLQEQIMAFHNTLLPTMQKEIEEYKAARMKETELMITKVVQKVSQEVLNTTLTLNDQQKLVLDSLEKAKKEGVFS